MNSKKRKSITDEKFGLMDELISRFKNRMIGVLREASVRAWEHYELTHHYHTPSLNSIHAVMDDFYYHVLYSAWESTRQEKKGAETKKRLAAKLPLGIPRRLPALEKIFRNKNYWPKIMKRSQKIADRIRDSYLEKLSKKFAHIMPEIDAGRLTPEEAKKDLVNTFQASESRVNMIFRTETTTYFTKTQLAVFQGDPEIIGFLFDDVKDQSETKWCRSRRGLIFKPGSEALRENQPPCHWNCRSHLIALANTAYNRKLLSDPSRDPDNRKLEPLPPGWR